MAWISVTLKKGFLVRTPYRDSWFVPHPRPVHVGWIQVQCRRMEVFSDDLGVSSLCRTGKCFSQNSLKFWTWLWCYWYFDYDITQTLKTSKELCWRGEGGWFGSTYTLWKWNIIKYKHINNYNGPTVHWIQSSCTNAHAHRYQFPKHDGLIKIHK